MIFIRCNYVLYYHKNFELMRCYIIPLVPGSYVRGDRNRKREIGYDWLLSFSVLHC